MRVFNPIGSQVGRTGLPQGRRDRPRRMLNASVTLLLVPLMAVGPETVLALNQEALLHDTGLAAAT